MIVREGEREREREREKLMMSHIFPSFKSCLVQPPAMEIDTECYKEVHQGAAPSLEGNRIDQPQ